MFTPWEIGGAFTFKDPKLAVKFSIREKWFGITVQDVMDVVKHEIKYGKVYAVTKDDPMKSIPETSDGVLMLSKKETALNIGTNNLWYCIKIRELLDVLEGIKESGIVTAQPSSNSSFKASEENSKTPQFSTHPPPSKRLNTGKLQP